MAIKKVGTKYPIETVKMPYKCSNDKCEYSTLKSLDLEEIEICPLCGETLIITHGCTTPDLEE